MPETDYKPTLTDVGAITLARTSDKYGNQTGTFSAETQPTNSQVSTIIDKSLQEVSREIGTEIPAGLFNDAKTVVALHAAMSIELSLFAHEIRSQNSAYQFFKDQYEDALESLKVSIQSEESGQTSKDAPSAKMAHYSFPESANILDRKM